jgi:uncharacterized membrane protein YciS (DUF1049 family)
MLGGEDLPVEEPDEIKLIPLSRPLELQIAEPWWGISVTRRGPLVWVVRDAPTPPELGAVRERRWSAARVLLQVAGFMLLLILISAARAHRQFDTGNALTWLFAVGFVTTLVGLLALYLRMERRAGRAQRQRTKPGRQRSDCSGLTTTTGGVTKERVQLTHRRDVPTWSLRAVGSIAGSGSTGLGARVGVLG